MRQKVKDKAQPWLDGWNALTGNGRAQLGAKPRPLATVILGDVPGQNFAQFYIDVARAYQLALRWKVLQDTRYADLAVVFLNEWSSTLKEVTGNADRFLAAGIYGYEFANAAEIMRTYPGWAPAYFNGKGVVRYGISTVHGFNEEGIDGTAALATGRWVHVAVTLSGMLGTLYVDGVVAGTNAEMTLTPADPGETTQPRSGPTPAVHSRGSNLDHFYAQ